MVDYRVAANQGETQQDGTGLRFSLDVNFSNSGAPAEVDLTRWFPRVTDTVRNQGGAIGLTACGGFDV